MGCCGPKDDCDTDGNHSCGCGGGSSCGGLKTWIVLGIVIVAIWYFIK